MNQYPIQFETSLPMDAPMINGEVFKISNDITIQVLANIYTLEHPKPATYLIILSRIIRKSFPSVILFEAAKLCAQSQNFAIAQVVAQSVTAGLKDTNIDLKQADDFNNNYLERTITGIIGRKYTETKGNITLARKPSEIIQPTKENPTPKQLKPLSTGNQVETKALVDEVLSELMNELSKIEITREDRQIAQQVMARLIRTPQIIIRKKYLNAFHPTKNRKGRVISAFGMVPKETVSLSVTQSTESRTTMKRSNNIVDSTTQETEEQMTQSIQNKAESANRVNSQSEVERDMKELLGVKTKVSGEASGGLFSWEAKVSGSVDVDWSEENSTNISNTLESEVESNIEAISETNIEQNQRANTERRIETAFESTVEQSQKSENKHVREFPSLNLTKILNISNHQMVQDYVTVKSITNIDVFLEFATNYLKVNPVRISKIFNEKAAEHVKNLFTVNSLGKRIPLLSENNVIINDSFATILKQNKIPLTEFSEDIQQLADDVYGIPVKLRKISNLTNAQYTSGQLDENVILEEHQMEHIKLDLEDRKLELDLKKKRNEYVGKIEDDDKKIFYLLQLLADDRRILDKIFMGNIQSDFIKNQMKEMKEFKQHRLDS
jgi:hypothetical protein